MDDDDRLRQPLARAYRARGRRRRRLGRAVRLPLALAILLLAGRVDAALPGGAYVRALLLVGAAAVVDAAAGLPLAVAAERDARAVGLSRLTNRLWIRDRFRGALVAGGLGAPMVLALLWAQRTWPDGWPLAAWAAGFALSVLLAVVFPVLLLPLFVSSSPLPPGDLRTMVDELVDASGVRIGDVRTLHLGERTSAGNAMVAGLGPSRRILLGDTLLEEGPTRGGDPLLEPRRADLVAETRAVLAHELAHQKSADTARFLALSLLTGLVEWQAAASLLARLPHALAHGGAGRPAALPALLVLLGLVGLPLGLLTAGFSRRRERAADAFAVSLVPGPLLARAFERLARNGLAELEPPVLERLQASHPPLGERIERARRAPQPVR